MHYLIILTYVCMFSAHEHGSDLSMYHGPTAIGMHPANVWQLVSAIHCHNLTERSTIVSLRCYIDPLLIQLFV